MILSSCPKKPTNLTDRFHEAFDLSQEDRNARLEELFENDVALSKAIDVNSTELTNRHRATLDIIAQLDQAINHSEELHGMTIACMTEGLGLAGFLPGNL